MVGPWLGTTGTWSIFIFKQNYVQGTTNSTWWDYLNWNMRQGVSNCTPIQIIKMSTYLQCKKKNSSTFYLLPRQHYHRILIPCHKILFFKEGVFCFSNDLLCVTLLECFCFYNLNSREKINRMNINWNVIFWMNTYMISLI